MLNFRGVSQPSNICNQLLPLVDLSTKTPPAHDGDLGDDSKLSIKKPGKTVKAPRFLFVERNSGFFLGFG